MSVLPKIEGVFWIQEKLCVPNGPGFQPFTVCILMQHPSILHQALPFHHHILKPFQMVPQIDCHPGRLLTWTASKRWKNPSVTMASWFSSLPTSLIFEIFIFLRCCAINLQLIGIKVSQYQGITAYISLFSYIGFSESKHVSPHFWISKATRNWFSVSTTGFPRLIFYFHGLSQSKTTKTTRHVRFGVCPNRSIFFHSSWSFEHGRDRLFSKKGAHVLWNKMNLLFTTPQELMSKASCKLCTKCLNKKRNKQTLSTSYPYHNLQYVKSRCLRQSALCRLGVSWKPTKKPSWSPLSAETP